MTILLLSIVAILLITLIVISIIKPKKERIVETPKDNAMKENGVPYIPFPISLSTVDMICVNKGTKTENPYEHINIMFGRKPGQEKWQFPGGFRDPGETSRQAASRELQEEANLNIISDRLKLIGEKFIDDIRYRNTPHKITTNIFLAEVSDTEMLKASPGDDLGEIKWFNLSELIKDNSCIRDIHVPIFDIVKAHFGA